MRYLPFHSTDIKPLCLLLVFVRGSLSWNGPEFAAPQGVDSRSYERTSTGGTCLLVQD